MSPVVYTAAFGPAAATLRPFAHPHVVAICFTDDPDLTVAGWEMQRCPAQSDPVRAARRLKSQIPTSIRAFPCSIWIDADLEINLHPKSLIGQCLAASDFASLRHPERRCTYQEAKMVQYLSLDAADIVRRQMRCYRKQGFPTNWGLLETSLVARRHEPRLLEGCDTWWHEIQQGSCRDQLSVMYALWKWAIAYTPLPGGRESSAWVRYAD